MQAEQAKLEQRSIASLRPYAGNARTHSKKQVRQIADSITRFGFTNPVLISDDGEIIAGHGRVSAAKLLGHETVPTLRLSHLNATQRRAYVLADNKLALNAGWDQEILAIELQALIDLEFDVSVTGFSLAEVDFTLDAARERAPDTPAAPADVIPPMNGPVVTRSGDLWQLARHRLICGDARNEADYTRLLAGESVDLIFTDPPYNVPIDGHVCGSGRIRHREFAMGVGEMSSTAFTEFLTETLGAARRRCRNGAIAYVCMDWRHVGELSAAGAAVFSELKNICVWNKTNAGMGTFTAPSMSWSSCSRWAPRLTSTALGSATPVAIAPTCGTIPGSPVWGRGGWRSWRCIRPSSRRRWSLTPSETAPAAATSCWTTLAARGRP